MQIEKYKHELERQNLDCKLLLRDLHNMSIREEDFKNFFESENISCDEIFLDELLSYEKELEIGETGN